MGVKLTIYNDLVTRITTKVPEFKTVRKWNNQFNNEDVENAFEYPACFIGFSNLEWTPPAARTAQLNTMQQQQNGVIVVTLYLGFHHLEEETDSWPIYEPLIQKIWYWIQGWTGTSIEYNSFVRIAEREDNNHNNVIVWEIDFQVGGTDCAAQDDTLVDAAPVDLVVNPVVYIDPNTDLTLRTDDELPALP